MRLRVTSLRRMIKGKLHVEFVRQELTSYSGLELLRPSLKTISLRLPELMLEELKLLANKRDGPSQSLLKLFLAERIEEELRQPNGGRVSGRGDR